MSISLRAQGLQHARIPCPSLSPGVYWNLCSLSCWCYLTVSCSVNHFSYSVQCFPALGSFFQQVGTLHQVANLLGLTGLISMQSKGLSRVFSNTTVQKHQCLSTQLSLWSNSHIHTWLLETDLVSKVMSLLFKILSRFVIAFLPRSKHILISWLQSPSMVILEPKKIKSVTVSIVSHLFAIKQWDQKPWC